MTLPIGKPSTYNYDLYNTIIYTVYVTLMIKLIIKGLIRQLIDENTLVEKIEILSWKNSMAGIQLGF